MAIIDGVAYEASMLHGCRVVPVAEAMQGASTYQDMQIWVPRADLAAKWGGDQDGKRYDFAGAFGLPLLMSEDWADDSKWWCSELVFKMLGMGGVWLLDPQEIKRVTPNHLRMCNYLKSQVVRLR